MRSTAFFFSLLLAARAAMAAPAESLLSEAPPKSVKLNEVVEFKVKSGYHFNIEAPQKCGASEAFDLSSGSVKCQFSSGGTQEVSLKFCADDQSMCLFENFSVQVAGGRPAARTEQPKAAASDAPLPGFLQNDMERALRQAAMDGKLVFADFYTKWCPFCRLMEDTVLNRPVFLEASSGMIRVSLDCDTPEARAWLTRFHPPGYPTYIVMDPKMREIGRMSGNTSAEAFASWLKKQQGWKNLPIAEAKAKVSSLDEAGKLRVARAYMEEKNWRAASGLLEGLKSREAEFLAADCRLRQAAESRQAGTAELYRSEIARFDGSDAQPAEIGVIDWIGALVKFSPETAKPFLEGGLLERLIASPDARAEGYTAEDIYVVLAGVLDEAGMKERSKEMYSKAADGYAALAEKAGRPALAKGLRMSQASNLAAAGRYEEAAAVYRSLASDFPGEYPFHRSLASMLFKLNKYPEALQEISAAAGLAYGDIRLDILYYKAKIEAGMKDKAAALKTLDDAIASVRLPDDRALKTHRMYTKLKEYRKEVAAQE